MSILSTRKKRGGFTLVEMMIVAAIIGLLAAIAVPGFIRARDNARNGRFVADLRTAKGAFELYAMEHGRYPADDLPGQIPAGMADYLQNIDWTGTTSLGGKWDWDYKQFGCTAGVSVYRPSVDATQLQKVDAMIDDGNLSVGFFRARANGYISVIE